MARYFTSLFLLFFQLTVSTYSYAKESSESSQRSYAQMLELGEVRMAVPYERGIYVESKKQILGASPEIAKYLGNFLSKKYNKPIKVTIVPATPGKLLDAIDEDKADFVLIYTLGYEEQLKSKKYLKYTHPHFEESVIVSGANSRPINSLLDLSGQDVCISRLKDSSALDEANKTLIKSGKKPINIYRDKNALDDEDFLQMLNGGLIQYTYVSNWKAQLWKPMYAGIQVNENLKSPGGAPGDLIVSSQNKALAEDILSFADSNDLTQGLNLYRKNDFVLRKNALKSPVTPAEWKRFQSMQPYFHQYGTQNHLDPLFLAGLGFQESVLNQSAVSPMGAIGVMQLLPSTGNSLGVGDIHQTEPNIHAGAKYINSLIYALSIDGNLSDAERTYFAVAAYNAGPNNIRKARALAESMEFDSNKWFGNVEMAAAKMFGNETFLYVRNVYKYYVAYDLRAKNASITEEKFIPEDPLKQ